MDKREMFLLKYKDVLSLIINGYKNKDIHSMYNISDKTLAKIRKLAYIK